MSTTASVQKAVGDRISEETGRRRSPSCGSTGRSTSRGPPRGSWPCSPSSTGWRCRLPEVGTAWYGVSVWPEADRTGPLRPASRRSRSPSTRCPCPQEAEVRRSDATTHLPRTSGFRGVRGHSGLVQWS